MSDHNVSEEISLKTSFSSRRSTATGYLNARRLVKGTDYAAACQALYGQISRQFTFIKGERVLVIGTEEFMYPALLAGFLLEEAGCLVKCHSTTRSPIAVSTEEEYPLHERYELHSLYEEERRTFLYDLEKYDKVIVLTDACGAYEKGMYDLYGSLRACGNEDICFVRWCE